MDGCMDGCIYALFDRFMARDNNHMGGLFYFEHCLFNFVSGDFLFSFFIARLLIIGNNKNLIGI